MEKESFENPAVGKLLNDHFVSIKVDREERPDVDKMYMTFIQVRCFCSFFFSTAFEIMRWFAVRLGYTIDFEGVKLGG